MLLLAWSFLGAAFPKRIRVVAAVAALLSLTSILYATLFSRDPAAAELHLIPFSSFARAAVRPEMYRSMLMNVFLFVPLGLSLPFVLRGSTAKRIWLTVLIGFLLSMTIETIQYLFSLGLVETDDVLCNTLGAAVGSASCLLSLLWQRRKADKAGK